MNDCLDRILEFYENKELYRSLNNQIWVSQFLIRLMRFLNKKYVDEDAKRVLIKSCLLLLINLCFDIKFPDHFHSRGKSFKDLSHHEKSEILGLLKDEINFSEYN